MSDSVIRVRGATQNNLKDVDIDIPLGELVVITGVSGSGKSSLAFDTIYAEGQRRYVETFSPYARQFLDRMDKPAAERIDGIPPAIAIDQTNPVRTSRSTVGTMTELSDHLKLLYARAASLFCQQCDAPVRPDEPEAIWAQTQKTFADQRIAIAFTIVKPDNFTTEELRGFLAQQGYLRVHAEDDKSLTIIQDRLRAENRNKTRFIEGLEAALRRGQNKVHVIQLDSGEDLKFSSALHCATCDISYQEPIPSQFSFNSPVGACETCRGFGRTMGIDYRLVIPDETLSIADGAVKVFQSKSYAGCQRDLKRHAKERGVDTSVPWRDLSAADKAWIIEGEGRRRSKKWYGIAGFFDWLETKAYKMHVRVLLSRFRSYDVCVDCDGSRLKPIAKQWRLGGTPASPDITTLATWPLDRVSNFFAKLRLPAAIDEAADLLLGEINARLSYLVETGLGYLTLDRQSRTLSGGEVQRINLTTALGTSLVNTLFVLDEPSIGLHPRDIGRIVAIMKRLRDSGNSLLVVEHDPDIILAADRVIDMGPGPGKAGGEVCFEGSVAALKRSRGSLTAPYLTGQRRVETDRKRQRVTRRSKAVRLSGVTANNLKNVDLRIPLNRFVVITGVSGSGKSTLIEDVLHPALLRHFGKPKNIPGPFKKLSVPASLSDVVMVDQSAIGKTTRSNPASFVGAFAAIRKRFVNEPLSIERGYTPGTFSFNSGNGRCPVCTGNGFEHVEMQFLADVYLRCSACNGNRYRDEILEVSVAPASGDGRSKSIAEVLEMTVDEAVVFFGEARDIMAALAPLRATGLGYLTLGQPVPTLSGGEAQRLKLAKHLAEAAKDARAGTTKLFLFDEPTTGLHFQDTEVLLRAFDALLEAGHSIAIIEHNLDVVAAADWVIDLGPEGGDGGGEIVFAGPLDELEKMSTATGQAYSAHIGPETPAKRLRKRRRSTKTISTIDIRKARENNLKNIDVIIPRDKFVVVSGVSGSGKSTLAFDIVFNEGQRRYLESLNAYARQFVQPAARPDVDAVFGIPPTVAIEQRTSRGGYRSTVGTLTEIHHFLRLLFVKLGEQHCPDCQIPITAQEPGEILATLLKTYRGQRIELAAPLVVGRKGYYTDLAKWALKKGFNYLRVDGKDLPTGDWPRLSRYKEHHIDLPLPAIKVTAKDEEQLRELLSVALDFGKGLVRAQADGESVLYSTKRACGQCQRSFDEPDPRLYSYNSAYGWCEDCQGKGVVTNEDAEADSVPETCTTCAGARLNPVARAVKFKDRSIQELSNWSVIEAAEYFATLKLKGRAGEIARDILTELRARLGFLNEVGLGYLALSRPAPTLSGGEAQRIRLAAQLGSQLRGVCYVLDEPTIGLHARDNARLLATLKQLKSLGNTVIVVEHDEETIRAAEHLIDVGPGAGVRGGNIVAAGSVAKVLRSPHSLTAKMLRDPLMHPLRNERRAVNPRRKNSRAIRIEKAHLNNLANVTVTIPLDGLVAVSGVSGSGKSSLVRGVLSSNLTAQLASRQAPPLIGCKSMRGAEPIDRVLEVDQTPIGKTPRSCPATYVGFWNAIRELYAGVPEARLRGYTASRFSFNVSEGRCAECDGQGVRRIEMSFLPDVRVHCEACHGARFNPETLSILYRDHSIGDVLAMDVEAAIDFFTAHPKILRPLALLRDVGLGYLTLGQQSPTLSGGEAQRIKLVSELAKARTLQDAGDGPLRPRGKRTLYVLDEPTIGLHMADVEKLIDVLHRLVDAGHSVIIIEHNLDILAEADWLIDLGPDGGDQGGQVLFQGPPEQMLSKKTRSITASSIRQLLDG